MRAIMIIILILLTISGLLTAKLPHVAKSLPIIGATGAWMQNLGLLAAPQKTAQASRDLWDIIHTHELGIWHFAVLALAVLLLRRTIVWLIH